MLSRRQIRAIIARYGNDILHDSTMVIPMNSLQHGKVTTYAHSIRVAATSIWLADKLGVLHKVHMADLVQASLLHDYFLYDWHNYDGGTHRWHGFNHGQRAAKLAKERFHINERVYQAIYYHMFPLVLPPRSLEGWLVSLADKISATDETIQARIEKLDNITPIVRSFTNALPIESVSKGAKKLLGLYCSGVTK